MNCGDEKVLKTYKRRVRWPTRPTISEELVFEIFVRLPAKTLVRFKSVCKAWHAMISDPFFIRMHLQRSANKQEQGPSSFLITPHTLDSVISSETWPTTFSNNISFYLWQEGQENTCDLVHSTDFHGEFGTIYPMSHCDGLVMLPTDTKVYVFNPAIGDVLKLPDGQKDEGPFPTVGFGLDPRTNTYKVARSFYRSVDFSKRNYDVGMEVFTINGEDDLCWRSSVKDPPYPIRPQVPMYFKGCVYWDIYEELLERPPQGFLQFSFEDETFSFMCYPSLLTEGEQVDLTVVGGELCLAQRLPTQIVIWMSLSAGDSRWVRLYVIDLLEARAFKPFFGTRDGLLMVRRGNYLYRCDKASRQTREVLCVDKVTYKGTRKGSFNYKARDSFYFNIIPYVESWFE